MNKKTYLILSIVLILLGCVNIGIVLLFGIFGTFVCGKPFYIIGGSSGPIPTCVSMFATEFIFPFLLGIILLIIGIIFIVLYKNKKSQI